MRAVDGKLGGGGVVFVTRSGPRMAPPPAPSAGTGRTTFAVGRLTWGRSELRVVEPRRLGPSAAGRGAASVETVH